MLKSLTAAAWCRSPPHAPRTIRRSRRPSGSRVSAQKHREHEHQETSECTLPSANVARMCRTMESPMITASHSVSQRGVKRLRVEISKTGGGGGEEVVAQGLEHIFCCCTQGPWFPGARVNDIWEDRICVIRSTWSRGGGSVNSALHTYPGLVSVSLGCFQCCFPLPQLGLLCQQLANLLLHGFQLQLHRMQLKCVLTYTQR